MCLPKITVIVPIYQVESYLERCVDSLRNQTYSNLEIILVDDGSPDNCGRMCDQYAQRDTRVHVIHKKNEGLGYARNTGLDSCTGEYIMFLDADDYLSSDAVEVLYERMVADGSDMAVGKHVDVHEDGTRNGSFCDWMPNAVVTSRDIFAAMGEQNRIAVFSCVKMFRRHLFDSLRYPALSCSEDLWVFPKLVEKCARISLVNHVIYFYMQRSTSILHRPTDERILDDVHAGLAFVRYLWDRGYSQSALWWLTVKIDKALILRNKHLADALFEQYFSRQEIRELLKAAGIKTSVKWVALHHPVVNACFQRAKRLIK